MGTIWPVRIDLNELKASYAEIHSRGASDASAAHRNRPRRSQYDFLELRLLRRDVERLIRHTAGPGIALDLGSGVSPYRDVVEAVGFELRTLDISSESNPNYGAIGKLGAPLYATMNAVAGLHRRVNNHLFCLNFACLAERSAA